MSPSDPSAERGEDGEERGADGWPRRVLVYSNAVINDVPRVEVLQWGGGGGGSRGDANAAHRTFDKKAILLTRFSIEEVRHG